jgi:hypothetical protein
MLQLVVQSGVLKNVVLVEVLGHSIKMITTAVEVGLSRTTRKF